MVVLLRNTRHLMMEKSVATPSHRY